MNPDNIGRWLTLGANLAVLVGILLLLTELRQNATMMPAQVSNDRTSHGIELFLGIAESSELSEIDSLLMEAGFPANPSAIDVLSPVQVRQYYWFLRANRFRIENLLAQQELGLIDISDTGPVIAGNFVLPRIESLGQPSNTQRLSELIEAVEMKQRQSQ